jgi:hypothetical protein
MCAFREHPAEVAPFPPEEAGVEALQFECAECAAKYVVSEALLEQHAARLRQSGETLGQIAKRLWAGGKMLKLITEADVTGWVLEQTRFGQQ